MAKKEKKKEEPKIEKKKTKGEFKDIDHEYKWEHSGKKTVIPYKKSKKTIMIFQKHLTEVEVEVSVYAYQCGRKKGLKEGRRLVSIQVMKRLKLEID